MAFMDDDDLDAMLEILKDDFGVAEKETVTESSYSFSGKHKEMREDLLFIEGMVKEKKGRLYMKSKLGFD